MAKKKKRRPPLRPSTPQQAASTPRERRERSRKARVRRERAVKQARRRATLRRIAFSAAAAVVVFVGFTLLTRAGAPKSISRAAVEAAKTANCSGVVTPVTDAPGSLHLQPGQPYRYSQEPATSGYHDPSPLSSSPHVYTQPLGTGDITETRAVHNLEHGYVLIYYQQTGADALPTDAVARLAHLANTQSKVILMPYPNLDQTSLAKGKGLAIAAWNKLQTCPSSIKPGQATTVASGFITAFVGTTNAPEPKGP